MRHPRLATLDGDPATPGDSAPGEVAVPRPAGRRPWRRHRLAGALATAVFLAPMMIIFGYFSWWPIIKGLIMSLQRTNLVTEPTWVGLSNYTRVLADPLFWTAAQNTLLFTVLSLLIGFLVPVLLAVTIAELRRTRSLASVLLVTRFFDELPREIFEAARIDHAGPFRLFIWIVLPMSKPVIWVVSLLIVVNAWKDFLWPMLVLPDRNLQPLSVALPRLESQEPSLFMAGLFMSVVVPIALFLIFQRQFFRSAGEAGALKG